MKSSFLLFLLIFSSSNTTVSHFSSEHYFCSLKDPNTAVILSSISPGMGHVYAGEPTKGMIIWTAESVLLYLGLSEIAEIRFGVTGSIGPSFTIAVKRHPETDEIIKASAFGAVFLGLYIYSIIDSRSAVEDYNRRVMANWKETGVPIITLEF